jgi:chemotaxis methyl-accepting protein methylase
MEETMNDEQALDAILAAVRSKTGLDFAAYRRPTVARRVRNRMVSLGVEALPVYLRVLESAQGEAEALVDRLAIKVSRFYRNAATFDLLRESVMPALAANAGGRALRVWSAGFGRGEEAYTLAMLLEERAVAGEVVATDIDPAAFAFAAGGIYPDAALEELPAALRDRFMESPRAGYWNVKTALRARVSWRVDDIASKASVPGQYDLVCCRNVLIYLDRPTQARVLARIAAAVAPGGYLLLGEAEWAPPDSMPALTAVAPRHRLFRMDGAARRLAA